MTDPHDPRGAAMWLYCLTDQRRRVVKVGYSANVPRRAKAVSVQGIAFLRQWCGLSIPNRTTFPIVRTWPLGGVSRSHAYAIEQRAHAALREVAPTSAGEWFHVNPRVAIPIIQRACAQFIQSEAA